MTTANLLGRYIVADVLEQVATGMDWESISNSWDGKVKKKAIAEAVRLAAEALDESDLGRPKVALP